jgi:hypothetical protein
MTPTFTGWEDDWAWQRFDGASEPLEPDGDEPVERPVDERYEDEPVGDA